MIAKTINNKISLDELYRMVGNPEVKDGELQDFFILDPRASNSFQPRIIPNPERVDLGQEATSIDFQATLVDIGIALANAIARERRHWQYLLTMKLPNRQKIVSEGDSWFQYPLLLADVIDQLTFRWPNYAIYSIGAAGDFLKDIVVQSEIALAVEMTGAEVLLLSGGGNDLLGGVTGDSNIKNLLRDFEPSLKPEDYPNENFESFLSEVIELYRSLLEKLTTQFNHLKILYHGYDYVIPVAGGAFLGNPMASKGITDPSLQQAIMKVVVDRLNEEQIALMAKMDRVFHIDCRGAVGNNQWFDEIHPTNEGYQHVAERFHQKIQEVSF
ncbi:MAG: SGNH/GDSL hydrolase family protein [Symploca sp. SIO2C1]|nr:SGNH/GDSL hydrolase family protein [Symploca sp. SIO2C1]